MSRTTATTFGSVSAVTPVDGQYAATLDPEWTIAGRPHGGYLLAIAGRAVTSVAPHPHVLAASAHYLRPPAPGPVRVAVDRLQAGRNSSRFRARLDQDGTTRVEALFTMGTLAADGVAHWQGGVPTPELPSPADGVRVPGRTPTGVAAPVMDQVDIRLDVESTRFFGGAPTGRGELWGWLTLPADEPFGPLSLLYAVDAFPPATLDVGNSGWVPTFALTAYVRALPAPGPVRVLHRAGLIDGGRVDETCHVWDHTGRLVAQSTQLAGIRLT